MASTSTSNKRPREPLLQSSTTPLAPRTYCLLISGTMNPPHAGHIRLGLKAALNLEAEGHAVSAICYLPVHDNYLCNKVTLKRAGGKAVSVPDSIAFPMKERCALLRSLLELEREAAGALAERCHVLDYEHSSGDAALLAESPGYWAPKLPDGYLKTVPTTSLISHFAAHSPLLQPETEGGARPRLGVVFGVDNLAGMASWNSPENLLADADLILLAREMPRVVFGRDPFGLLGALKHVEVRAAVPVVYEETELFGGVTGSFVHEGASGEGALFLLPPLDGKDEELSSTRIRNAIGEKSDGAALNATLAKHGFGEDSFGRLLEVATNEAVDEMVASGGHANSSSAC